MREMPSVASNTFVKEEILGLSKEELIVKLYDIGVSACIAKDKGRVLEVIAELIDSLNFDHGEIPARLFRLYQYAMMEARKGHFGEPMHILQGLKESWVKAFNLQKFSEGL
ncbi:MAG: flagellar protein FliS [bacterium]|nr:flagellar protein FliS [bacterium]